jgi:hypothetical protein
MTKEMTKEERDLWEQALAIEFSTPKTAATKIMKFAEAHYEAKMKEVVPSELIKFVKWFTKAIPSYETTEEEIVNTYLTQQLNKNDHICKPMVNADWTYLKCECGRKFKPK